MASPDQIMRSIVEERFANAQIEINEQGGKQSKIEVRYDLLSPIAMERLAHVIWYGTERYGVNNWKKIDSNSHINHAILHAYKHLAGDTSEDHLGHFLCRAMMALDMFEQEKQTNDTL